MAIGCLCDLNGIEFSSFVPTPAEETRKGHDVFVTNDIRCSA